MKRNALRNLVVMLALATTVAGYSSARAGNPATPQAAIIVDSLADELQTDGNCTLREAIQAAGANQAVDGCVAGDQLDTITFALDGVIELALGEFVVTTPIEIMGNGRVETVIDALGGSAIFHVSGVTLELNSLTLQNGFNESGGAVQVEDAPVGGALELTDVVIQDSVAQTDGGAVAVPAGPLRVFDSLFQGNSAARGGAMYAGNQQIIIEDSTFSANQALTSSGGALYCDNCDLNIERTVMEDNSALALQGGAIYCRDCSGVVSDSTLVDNVSELAGGAVYLTISGSYPTEEFGILRSLVAGNSSLHGDGGGIYCKCFLSVTKSTIRENTALAGDGGGIYAVQALVEVQSSTFNGNYATLGSGGGLYYQVDGAAHSFLVNNSTISGNGALTGGGLSVETVGETVGVIRFTTMTENTATAATAAGGAIFVEPAGNPITLARNIIHDNSGAPACYPAGDALSNGGNVLQDDSCGNHVNDQVGVNPRIGPLENYGGPTETHALLPGSPAIDAATCLDVVPLDQRGVIRPQNESCDSGSYEFEGRSGLDTYLPLLLK